MEKEIKQILENQKVMLGALTVVTKPDGIITESLDKCYWDTIELLKLKDNQPTLPDRTHDALKEDFAKKDTSATSEKLAKKEDFKSKTDSAEPHKAELKEVRENGE